MDTLDEAFLGPRAAGVIIVVTERHASGWADIAFDFSGRAIAASLDTSGGSTVRVVGAYGVSGANCTNFTLFSEKVIAESLLCEFISEQVAFSDKKGIHMVVAGDMNSYQQPSIDHNGGPSVVRPECLTSHLLSHGFCDTFRHRFPITPAFTHISKAGGSRLDQIWIRPAPGLSLAIVLACIIWEWESQSDHCPIVADLFSSIPIIHDVVERQRQPPWRALLADLSDK